MSLPSAVGLATLLSQFSRIVRARYRNQIAKVCNVPTLRFSEAAGASKSAYLCGTIRDDPNRIVDSGAPWLPGD
jgi:hypothetical protein